MKIFLAGAAGAIGRRLTPLLLDAGHRVWGLTRDAERARALERSGVHAVIADVYDARALRGALAEANPQVVIHQLTDLPQSRDLRGDPAALGRNARIREVGTRSLVEAALACGAARMISQSLAFAYASGGEPHVESDPLEASRSSVITLERLTLKSPPLIGCVLRFGSFYGPGTWSDDAAGNVPVHVDAAAWATLLAVERSGSGTFNIAEERGYVSSARARAELGWSPAFRLP